MVCVSRGKEQDDVGHYILACRVTKKWAPAKEQYERKFGMMDWTGGKYGMEKQDRTKKGQDQ